LSLRGKGHDVKVDLTTNPIPTMPGSQHWLQKRFKIHEAPLNENYVYEDETLGKVCILKSNYHANMFVTQRAVNILEGYKLTNPALYQMWTLGNFAIVEGVILKNWKIVKEDPDKRLYRGVGMDFGISNDETAAVQGWIDEKNRIAWIKPIIHRLGMVSSDIVDELKAQGVHEYDNIAADQAAAVQIEEINRLGYRKCYGARKGANYKGPAAMVLQGYELRIISTQFDNKIRQQLSTWAWQKDKNGNQLPKPTDGNDHFIDAIIYLMRDLLDKPEKKISFHNIHF
jgi:phage terminase large subunit